MKKTAIVTFLTILVHYLSIGQETVVLSGFVTDATTGEEIIGANVYIDGTTTGTITNSYGYYSLNVPKSELTIVYSFMGSETVKKEMQLTESMKINIELQPASLTLNEVVVKGEKEDRNVRSVEMGVNKLSMKEAEEIPVIFGEKDIIKTIQLMPGIRSSSEASSGFNVRGGGSDQNLILLDEAPVYNASHLMGFFSVFNSDALKDVKMMKGTAPAEYGGRLSSVLDVKMKEGNSKNISTSGGIGLISSRATVEGPINNGKGSFIVSGRRTYADLLLKAFSNDYDDYELYFYDLNAKANYRISDKDRIFISGYFGRDILGVSDAFGFDWGNKTATVRWNHVFGDRLFSNTSFIYSKYDYKAQMGEEASILSSIEDFNLKTDFQYFVNPTSTVRFGLNGIKHGFVPGKLELEDRPEENEDINKNALEGAAYISHDVSFGDRIKINYGLRYSVFNEIGPGEYYTFNEQGDVRDTISYADADPIVYHNFEPRFSLNYTVDKSSSIKAAYARNSQYLHILSNTSGGSPFDVYIPSSALVKPQLADQVSLGYFRNFKDNSIESSIEVYYKKMQNLIDYKEGADILVNPLVESQLVFGEGWAYGTELLVKKKQGKLTGWLAYTWSKSERKFDDIDNGNPFPSANDITHDFNIVGTYALSEKWKFSASWVYNTGKAITYPSGKYYVDGNLVNYYTERNSSRMPDYHRLDLGITRNFIKSKKYESSLTFSLYNAYGRENAYTITFEQNPDIPTNTQAVKLALFSYVPSLTYNFKF